MGRCRTAAVLFVVTSAVLLRGGDGQDDGDAAQPPPAEQPPPAAQPAAAQPHKRFEYKYSFKPPYLAQKDGTVPFFEYTGNAIASQESVRITPSLRSQKGSIWSKSATAFDWWEAEIHFRVTGRGRIGADGLAFWFARNKGVEGPVFGSNDKWDGLGVFFDSFDNDNKHNNPYIMAMGNDGTLLYDHQRDGTTQQLAGCLRDFRNKPYPVKAKIEFYNNILTVMFHNGMSNNDADFELCLRVENVVLPKAGYFGLSAATGGLADDHDVLKFSLSSLHASAQSSLAADEDAQNKIKVEYEEYQKKLKDQKLKWAEENPEEAKKLKGDDDDWEDWMSESDKEFQQILQGQNSMKGVVTELHRKFDEIIGRQERALSILTAIQNGQYAVGAPAAGGGRQTAPPAVGGGGGDTIRRDEVTAILANQREIVGASRDIKNFVADVHKQTGQLLQKGSAQPMDYEVGVSIKELKHELQSMKRDISGAAQKMAAGGAQKCPEVIMSNCVTTTMFIVLMVVQIIIMISFMMYRNNKEAQAKKFY